MICVFNNYIDQGHIAKMTREEIKTLLGTKRTGGPVLPKVTHPGVQVPDEFDCRSNWPQCAPTTAALTNFDTGNGRGNHY